MKAIDVPYIHHEQRKNNNRDDTSPVAKTKKTIGREAFRPEERKGRNGGVARGRRKQGLELAFLFKGTDSNSMVVLHVAREKATSPHATKRRPSVRPSRAVATRQPDPQRARAANKAQ